MFMKIYGNTYNKVKQLKREIEVLEGTYKEYNEALKSCDITEANYKGIKATFNNSLENFRKQINAKQKEINYELSNRVVNTK